mgnify:CR=1 FL=1
MKNIQVTRSSMPEIDEYIEEIKDIWDSRWLTNMGSKHKRLQAELKDYMAVENVELLTNGHMALELTMQAMGLEGEVITTPFTFASTTHAIVRNGLKPVFCDINPVDFTIDTTKIEELITDKTCAIIMETVQGEGGIYPATQEFLQQVRALCDEKDILLILDEIQCGMGRTGYMFAWQKYGVKPDMMAMAKGTKP